MSLHVGLGTFSGQRPAERSQPVADIYADVVALAQHAEACGFDSVWIASHHGHPAEHVSAPLVLLAAVAATTTRIRLATGMVIAPLQHPIRFAEDCATLDQVSRGRLTVGMSVGWREQEFAMFGIAMAERAARTEALIRFCRAAWDEGTAELDGRSVVVRPRPSGRIPIALGGSAPPALRRAGRLADLFVATGTPAIGIPAMLSQVNVVDTAATAAGRPDIGVGFQTNCWVSRDGRLPAEVEHGMWSQIGASLMTHGEASGASERPMLDADEVARRSIIGTPEQVVEQLAPWLSALGGRESHLVVRLHYPGLRRELSAEAVELFGTEVAPRLRELA